MRRVLLATLGSYGDLHPYIAMGKALRAHGVEVVLVTHTHYRDQVERAGLEFAAVKPGPDDIGPEEEWGAQASHRFDGPRTVIRDLLIPFLEDQYRVLNDVAPSCDLIIGHILAFAAPLVAERRQIPWLSCLLQPSTMFSAYDPPALSPIPWLPRLKFLGPGFFRFLYGVMAWKTAPWLKPVHQLRQKIGLAGTTRHPLMEGLSPDGTLALFTEQFAPPPPDRPANLRYVGFPLYDQETTAEGSPALQEFLASGPPPIVFTLGSAVVLMQTGFYDIAYRAIEHLGERAVFLVGKKEQRLPPAAKDNPRVLISPYEPFSAVFPHARAIVHQCGIGTTAQALAASKPQVLVPFSHDQPDNAQRVQRLGLGLMLPSWKLTVPRLVRTLKRVLEDQEFARQAEIFSKGVSREAFSERLFSAVTELYESRGVETAPTH